MVSGLMDLLVYVHLVSLVTSFLLDRVVSTNLSQVFTYRFEIIIIFFWLVVAGDIDDFFRESSYVVATKAAE